MTLVQTLAMFGWVFLAVGLLSGAAGVILGQRKAYDVAIPLTRAGSITCFIATAFLVASVIASAK